MKKIPFHFCFRNYWCEISSSKWQLESRVRCLEWSKQPRISSKPMTILHKIYAFKIIHSSVQFSSVAPTLCHPMDCSSVQSCLKLCDPMNWSTPGLPVHRQLPEFTQTRVIPSSHLSLCHPLLLLPSIFPSIRVFSKESALRIRWPNYWSFSLSISPSNEHPGLISFRMDWLDLVNTQDWSPLGWTGWISLQSKGLSSVFSNTTVQEHQFFSAQLSLFTHTYYVYK